MKNLKKLSRTLLKNLHGGKAASGSTGIGNGGEEAQPCYCSTEQGSTFLGYMTYDGCYYACTKNLDNQPK
ncbi:hypothetical protein [uncultured Chryseobacterium sp.]|uniref:bacteriocin-like protein n=1 Tax=uncultured Chryseobacterium sp. TaxID=259322 RepID=UPI0025F140A0|nr:hypothetical protein [uncultured Chryseobacterium sp.]